MAVSSSSRPLLSRLGLPSRPFAGRYPCSVSFHPSSMSSPTIRPTHFVPPVFVTSSERRNPPVFKKGSTSSFHSSVIWVAPPFLSFAGHYPIRCVPVHSSVSTVPSFGRIIWECLYPPFIYWLTVTGALHVGTRLAPSIDISEYVPIVWRSLTVIALVLFLIRVMDKIVNRLNGNHKLIWLVVNNSLTIALCIVSCMYLAEVWMIANGTARTIGVATAIMGKDILLDILGGICLRFSWSFLVGDQIKSGNEIEGKVMDIGFLTTELLRDDGSKCFVRNSHFITRLKKLDNLVLQAMSMMIGLAEWKSRGVKVRLHFYFSCCHSL